jgi:hypothetical protein
MRRLAERPRIAAIQSVMRPLAPVGTQPWPSTMVSTEPTSVVEAMAAARDERAVVAEKMLPREQGVVRNRGKAWHAGKQSGWAAAPRRT